MWYCCQCDNYLPKNKISKKILLGKSHNEKSLIKWQNENQSANELNVSNTSESLILWDCLMNAGLLHSDFVVKSIMCISFPRWWNKKCVIKVLVIQLWKADTYIFVLGFQMIGFGSLTKVNHEENFEPTHFMSHSSCPTTGSIQLLVESQKG